MKSLLTTTAAYFHQSVNLVVGVAMVPLLLRHLNVSDYILWSIFIAFGGLSLQLETSIQMLAVRDIARQFHGGKAEGMAAAMRRARLMYHGLAAITALPMAAAGFFYLLLGTDGKIGAEWKLEWGLFVTTYAINYWFGINSARLLATDRVATFSLISGCTRIMNFCLTWLLLAMGYAVLGICLSFAISMLINVGFIWLANRRRPQPNLMVTTNDIAVTHAIAGARVTPSNLYRYTLFVFAGYAQYRGGILLATSFFPAEQVASYALSLQAFGMVCTLSTVPVQAWLARLVTKIVANDNAGLLNELKCTLLAVNTLFLSCTVVLLFAGDTLLAAIGSRLQLPSTGILALVATAFFLEANFFTIVNVFITRGSYAFVKLSLMTTGLALAGMLIAAALGTPLSFAMLGIPISIQAGITLPLVINLLAKQLQMSVLQMLSIMVFSKVCKI